MCGIFRCFFIRFLSLLITTFVKSIKVVNLYANENDMKRFFVILLTVFAFAVSAFAQSDTTRVLVIGNSFSYYNDSYDMLARIADTNGHVLDVVHSCQPGYSIGDHLNHQATTDAILAGGYDFAIVQDQSRTPANYAKDPKGNAIARMHFITLTNRIFGWSPYAKIVVENTWSYPADNWGGFGSEQEFNYFLENGTRLYSEVVLGKVSPVGQAFSAVRKARRDISLLDEDQTHPSAAGSYLKSCVNYLTIFGGKFEMFTDDCGLDPMVAKYLRTVATNVVNGK